MRPRATEGVPGRVARKAGRREKIISEETSVRKETQPRETTVPGSFAGESG